MLSSGRHAAIEPGGTYPCTETLAYTMQSGPRIVPGEVTAPAGEVQERSRRDEGQVRAWRAEVRQVGVQRASVGHGVIRHRR
jgi:hypothetical protein